MKKITLTLMTVLLAAGTLFASGTSDGRTTWFNADKKADAASYYTPLSRVAEATYTDVNGNVSYTESATATYALSNYGNVVKRSITGDSSVFGILDKIYDGYVLTPFEDDLISMDKDYVGQETVDGVLCDVFTAEISLDSNLFFFGSSPSGDVLGWDSDEDDFDGDMTITIYINAETADIVKQVAVYKDLDTLPNLEIVQTAYYSVFTVDGQSVALPSTVVTEGSYREKAGKASIYDIKSFSITETISEYAYNKNYDHE